MATLSVGLAPQIAFVFSITIMFVFIPISIIGIRKLWSYKNESFIIKRFPFIVFGLNISYVIIMIFCSISQFIFILTINNQYIAYITSNIFYFLSLWLLLYFLNVRNWMILHNYYWRNEKQQEWKTIINPTHPKNDKNSKYNQNLRNIKRISFKFAIIHIIGFLICVSSTIIICSNNEIHVIEGSIIEILFLSPAIIYYIWIVWKTPHFKDILWIYHESKIYSRLLASLGIINIIYCILFTIVDRNKYWIWIVIAIMSTVSIFAFILCYISTFIIINKNSPKPNLKNQVPSCHSEITIELILSNYEALELFVQHLSKELSVITLYFFVFNTFFMHKHLMYNYYFYIITNKIHSKNHHQKRMIRIINIQCSMDMIFLYITKSNKTYKTYNTKLNRMSIECILSYIEFIQFQNYLIRQSKANDYEISQDALSKCTMLDIAADIPNSALVNQEQITQRSSKEDNAAELELTIWRAKAHELYRKYIKVGSEHEINLAGSERSYFSDKMDDIDDFMNSDISIDDLLILFESTKKAMRILLVFSLNRWKRRPSFNQLLNAIDQQHDVDIVIKMNNNSTNRSNTSIITRNNEPKTPITPDETSSFRINNHKSTTSKPIV